ncbi:M24 family metallopeptidase [Mesorhizobium sp. B4-1-4]|uniref:M24 family metallopeptidase n=1 Tax=Mesorhizobium sp. B4-1-4 TaxID=2589888 RepID=UPI0011261EA2|nr:Xaa-Pro peptidase family protein [Mesorhizobium sp. B4-1-4]UCI31946.1 Xaa-Pro peptidase family protein [Mesorhizobium sp. B4-1-4]
MTIIKMSQVFPRNEYLRRLSAVKAEMKRREIAVAIVTVPANITYLTGYTSKSGYVPQGLMIDLEDQEPTFFTRRMDAPAAKHQMFIDNGHIIGYPEALIANPEKDGYDVAIDFLMDHHLGDKRIGLETSSLPAATVQKFKTRLPLAKIDDFTNCVAWIRGVKSDLEIALMREAAANTDAGMLRARDVIRPDVREADAAAEIIAALTRGVDNKPSTDVSGFFLCATPRTGTCHIRWTEDTFQSGSQVNLEFSGNRHGYTSPLMRTISVGQPSDRLKRIHEGEVAGLEAALEAAKTGAACNDVAVAFNTALRKHGFEKESRCGYAVGIDWTEPTASLKEGDMTILQPNMTFHLMLGNWVDDEFGYVISETFRVTDLGGETFSKFPRDIITV